MELKSIQVQDTAGNTVANARVTVYEEGGETIATIFNEAGNPKPNPFMTDATGWASFRAATGSYEAYAIIDDLGNTVPIYLTFMSPEEFDPAGAADAAAEYGADLANATGELDAGRVAGVSWVFNSVAGMQASSWPTVGMTVRTLGYYSPGDGGGNDYEIVAAGTGTDDGGSFIDLNGNGLQAKGLFLNNRAHIIQFGAIGDGVADDTAAIQSAIDASAGKDLHFSGLGVYRYDPEVGINIANSINVITHGAVLQPTKTPESYSFLVSSDGTYIDELNIEIIDTSVSRYRARCVQITGSDVTIGKLTITGTAERTGANGNEYNALKIGPDSFPRARNINIGLIESLNWDRPIVIQNADGWSIGNIVVENYRRAVYIKDSKNGEIRKGHAYGMSSGSNGSAGENGILIESVAEDYGTENITILSFVAEDSGEHGFRIGGQKIIRNVWHIGCTARRSGSGMDEEGNIEPNGPGDHGGCGFKALGPTSRYGARHQNIYYTDCVAEALVVDRPERNLNFAAFQLGKVYSGVVSNPVVRPALDDTSYTQDGYSCNNGIEIIGCENLSVNNPTVISSLRSAIYIYDSDSSGNYDWGLTSNITINGGSASLVGGAGIEVVANYTSMRYITINGIQIESATNALKATNSGNGAFLSCTIDVTAWLLSGDTFFGAGDWIVSGRGQLVGSQPVRVGSTFSSFYDNCLLTYEGDGWAEPSSTLTFVIDTDKVIRFIPKRSSQWLMVATGGTNYNGMAWVRTTSSPASIAYNAGGNFALQNTALDGETGGAGNITVGVQPGEIFIENRSGNTQTIRVTQL